MYIYPEDRKKDELLSNTGMCLQT